MTRPLQRWLPASLAAYAQGVCAVTFLFAIFATPWSYRVALIADILLLSREFLNRQLSESRSMLRELQREARRA